MPLESHTWSKEPWPGNFNMTAGDYARARACVGFCAGVPSEEMEIGGAQRSRDAFAGALLDIINLRTQRDELLEALKRIEWTSGSNGGFEDALKAVHEIARAALEKGGAK
jgi:hypothetical protein